jgi:amyloid beta precursor protein binding protein 1
MSLDFENMDVTDHGHIPYVIILVRLLEEWKKTVSLCYLKPD